MRLDCEPSAQTEVLRALDQVFMKDNSTLCSSQFCFKPDQSPYTLIAQFGQIAKSGRVLVVPNIYIQEITEATVL